MTASESEGVTKNLSARGGASARSSSTAPPEERRGEAGGREEGKREGAEGGGKGGMSPCPSTLHLELRTKAHCRSLPCPPSPCLPSVSVPTSPPACTTSFLFLLIAQCTFPLYVLTSLPLLCSALPRSLPRSLAPCCRQRTCGRGSCCDLAPSQPLVSTRKPVPSCAQFTTGNMRLLRHHYYER
eukprot:3922321-Rhodomonas_salina.2